MKNLVTYVLKWLHAQFCCEDDFVVIIMFSVNVFSTKVVDNLIILLVLKFHDFRTIDLRVIDFY